MTERTPSEALVYDEALSELSHSMWKLIMLRYRFHEKVFPIIPPDKVDKSAPVFTAEDWRRVKDD